VFFYERRLRATEAFSSVNDDLLRVRARSRSRSRSLTRVASNMSLGKFFTRSRSTSPSRRSSVDDDDDGDDALDQASASHVPDPIFKVATVNKQVESEFRSQSTTSYPNEPFLTTAAESNTMAPRGYKPSQINTQPHGRHHADTRGTPSEIFHRQDYNFIDSFNESPQPDNDLYGGTNTYQDNSYSRPYPYSTRRSSVQSHNTNLDMTQFARPTKSSSPDFISQSSSNNSSSTSSETTPIDHQAFFSPSNQSSGQMYNSITSYTSSTRSYWDDGRDYFSTNRERYGSGRSNTTYDENLMNNIDASRRMASSCSTGRRPSLNPNLFKSPPQQRQPNRACTNPADMASTVAILRNDLAGMFDNLIKRQPQSNSQQDLGLYYQNGVRDIQTVSNTIN
jgi:hypothetical protein